MAYQYTRWFLGESYGSPNEAVHIGTSLANFERWAVVGFLTLLENRWLEGGFYASDPQPRYVLLFIINSLKEADKMLVRELYLGIRDLR